MSEAAMNADRFSEGQRIILAISGVALLLISLSIAVSVSAISVPASTVWGILANKVSPDLFAPIWRHGREAIVWEIRFPRALLAIMVGSGLAIFGAALLAVTRNPLDDLHLLGISSGGAFGAIFALLHSGLLVGLLTVPLLAFAGALLATAIVLGVSWIADATSADHLVLAGVAVSFIIIAAANGLIFFWVTQGHLIQWYFGCWAGLVSRNGLNSSILW